MVVFKTRKKIVILVAAALLFLAASATVPARGSDPLSAIRGNEATLQYFFAQMPKGADLHNHLTGSVYAETYLNIALENQMFLDLQTYRLYRAGASGIPPSAIQLSPDMPNLHALAVQCIDHWSVRNYEYYSQTLITRIVFSGKAEGQEGGVAWQSLAVWDNSSQISPAACSAS